MPEDEPHQDWFRLRSAAVRSRLSVFLLPLGGVLTVAWIAAIGWWIIEGALAVVSG